MFSSGDPNNGGSFSRTTLEEKNSGSPIKLTIGYKYLSFYSLEFVYFDVGQFEFTKNGEFSDGTNLTTTSDIEKYDGNLFGVSNKFTYQANQSIELYGRLGFYFSKGDFTNRQIMVSTITNNNSDYTITKSYSEQAFETGVGVGYNINESISMNLEYVIYSGVVDSVDASATGLNLKYIF